MQFISLIMYIEYGNQSRIRINMFSQMKDTHIVQELAIKKRHQAYRIAAIVHIARLKPKS